jgi:hypothetical protein
MRDLVGGGREIGFLTVGLGGSSKIAEKNMHEIAVIAHIRRRSLNLELG